MAQPFVHQLTVAGPRGPKTQDLALGTTTIGRQTENDVLLEHAHVSRQHAEIRCSASECQIVDLGSANGTRVNGARLRPHAPLPLAHGATIEIGPFTLTFKRVTARTPQAQASSPPQEKVAPSLASREQAQSPATSTPPPETQGEEARPAPRPPTPAAPPPGDTGLAEETPVPTGVELCSRRLLSYLPGIYHTDFMARFLSIFESILAPIEWNIDSFCLYLDPGTAPAAFLPWLANWFEIALDSTWSEEQRRTLLAEAHRIYARRGTRWGLSRVLEIYTGRVPEIVDGGPDQEPFTFTVKLPLARRDVNRQLVQRIIDAHKPAHTTYRLAFES